MVIQPEPCHIPTRPVSADPKSLEVIATPKGVGFWVNDFDWRALLKHEIEWRAFAERAERCEVGDR